MIEVNRPKRKLLVKKSFRQLSAALFLVKSCSNKAELTQQQPFNPIQHGWTCLQTTAKMVHSTLWPFFRLTPSVAGSISDKSQPFGARLLYATKLLHIKDVWAMRVLARKAGFQQQDLSMSELSISRRSGYLISAARNILLRYISRSTMLSSGRHCDDPMPLGALSGETRSVYGTDRF